MLGGATTAWQHHTIRLCCAIIIARSLVMFFARSGFHNKLRERQWFCFHLSHHTWSTKSIHGMILLDYSGYFHHVSQKSVSWLLSKDRRHGLKLFVMRALCNTSPCLLPSIRPYLRVIYPCGKLKSIVALQKTALLIIKSAKIPHWESIIYQHSSCSITKMTCWQYRNIVGIFAPLL